MDSSGGWTPDRHHDDWLRIEGRNAAGIRRRVSCSRHEDDRIFRYRKVVPGRTSTEPDAAVAAVDVSAYTASINYDTPAARIQMTRKQVVEPGRVRPAPVEQKPDQYISGTAAWNIAAAPSGAPAAQGAP